MLVPSLVEDEEHWSTLRGGNTTSSHQRDVVDTMIVNAFSINTETGVLDHTNITANKASIAPTINKGLALPGGFGLTGTVGDCADVDGPSVFRS